MFISRFLAAASMASIAFAGAAIAFAGAALAHVVSHEDELRAVSTGGKAEVGDYLADRMGTPIRVPSLESFDYRLIGSRVLPNTDEPAAQLVFADQSG